MSENHSIPLAHVEEVIALVSKLSPTPGAGISLLALTIYILDQQYANEDSPISIDEVVIDLFKQFAGGHEETLQ